MPQNKFAFAAKSKKSMKLKKQLASQKRIALGQSTNWPVEQFNPSLDTMLPAESGEQFETGEELEEMEN